jgi:hypothetical protein
MKPICRKCLFLALPTDPVICADPFLESKLDLRLEIASITKQGFNATSTMQLLLILHLLKKYVHAFRGFQDFG